MKAADLFFLLVKPFRTTIALVCLLTFHAVAAKSEAPVSKSATKTKPPINLILDLPDNFVSSKDYNPQILPNTPYFGQKNNDNQQLIAGDKKKRSLNVDCGMDMYQNSAPEVPMSSRLTGECDFKYHY